jgi:hypothetical protein
VVVRGESTEGRVEFAEPESDASYFVTLTPVSGDGREGARRIISVAKSQSGFRLNVEAPPGNGKSVTFDWHLVR